MTRFLCGAVAPILVLLLASFSPPTRTVPVRLSDLTLDRVFRETMPPASGSPLSVTMPTTMGIVITTVTRSLNNAAASIEFHVNGGVGQSFLLASLEYGTPRAIDPPLIIRPGDTLTIINGGEMTIGGYFVYPGEV